MNKKLPPLPTISEIIRLYRLSTIKDLSQNFILDLNITDKLVRGIGNLKGGTVIEVGPGPGSLTRSLLNGGVKKLIVVEKDKRFKPALETLADASGGRMKLIFADMLRVDEEELLAGEEKHSWEDEGCPISMVGNLPFGVSTELMLKWLRQIPERKGAFAYGRASMGLMFQLEVARRLSANSSTPEYGRLSVMCQQSCTAINKFDLPGSVFVPPPKVSATLVVVKPRVTPLAPAPLDGLEYVCRQVMGQRRKRLSNAIKTLGEGMGPLLEAADLNPERRPDQLTVEEWCRLARVFKSWSVKTNTPIPLEKYYPHADETE